MNKFLITLVAALSFAVAGVANAEMTMSGSLSQFVAMGDKVDGGVTSKFNRMTFGANTTTDNGWTVGGSFSAEFGSFGSGTNSAYLPTSNSMYAQTDMGTIAVGQTADGVTALIPRIGAMVPGGGHDAGYQYLFDGGSKASNGVGFAEAYYAMAPSRVDYRAPSVNGFSVGITYTPSMEFDPGQAITRQQAASGGGRHGETVHAAAQYVGEAEGISYTIAIGSISGNSQGNADATNTLATFTNNDLSAVTGAVKVVSGNFTVGGHWYNNGDSFGASADAIQAKDDGYTVAMEYAMGNITLGALYAHQELVRGTRAATNRTTAAAGTAGNVYEDDVIIFGIGYNMGGGVNTFVQYNQMTHSDGDHAVVTDVDPSVLIAGITLGF